jgi:hypothetical protein
MHGFGDPFEGYQDGDDFRDDDRMRISDEQRMRKHQAALRNGRAAAIRARMTRGTSLPKMDDDARVSMDAAMWESVEHFTDEVWLNLTPEALYDWSGRGPIIR